MFCVLFFFDNFCRRYIYIYSSKNCTCWPCKVRVLTGYGRYVWTYFEKDLTLPETYRVLSPEEAMCCLQESGKTFQWPAPPKKGHETHNGYETTDQQDVWGQIFSSWHDLQTCVGFLKVDSPTNFRFRFVFTEEAEPCWKKNQEPCCMAWNARKLSRDHSVRSWTDFGESNTGHWPCMPILCTKITATKVLGQFRFSHMLRHNSYSTDIPILSCTIIIPIIWNLLPDFLDKAATESTIDSIDASLVKESCQRQNPHSASGFFYVSIISLPGMY